MEVADLHNEGLVDVVAAFEDLKKESSNGPDFFSTMHVFEKALPHLDASVPSVMRCVLHLFREAGHDDMVAGTIHNGFMGFCERDASRPRQALKEIESNPDELVDMLPATIAAGSKHDYSHYLVEVVRLSHCPNVEIRRRAVFSIASISWPQGVTVPDSAFDALEQSAARETDDQILANIVTSAFALLQQDATKESRAVALIGRVLPKGDEQTIYAASNVFGRHTEALPLSLLELLLTYLKRVEPEHKGTLGNIDWGISHLLKQGEHERTLGFLEELLIAHPEKLTLKTFDSTAAGIRESDALISKVLTRWCLRGERTLCEGVYEIAGTIHGDDLRVEVDPAELEPLCPDHIIFVARKAIGYFFVKPVTAASVLISLMRLSPDNETLDTLGNLLHNPLLLNYPGNLREYVTEQAQKESGKTKETIEKVLTSVEEYLEALRGVPALPALHPSQANRESYRRRMSDSMGEAMKAAEESSALLNLFPRATLLYGRKSINYIYGGDGQRHRTEIPLTGHSVTMEMPRMDNLDPYGLDYILRVFRVEQFRE